MSACSSLPRLVLSLCLAWFVSYLFQRRFLKNSCSVLSLPCLAGVIALLKQKDFLSEPVGVHLVPSSAPSEVKNHEDKRRPEIEDKFMVHASKSSYPSYPGIYSFKVTFSPQ